MMEWILLGAVIVLCVIIHKVCKELDELRHIQVIMYKEVYKEQFQKAKAMYYEKCGDDAE
jgi:hypothetical protein